jgi:hypothetical protein
LHAVRLDGGRDELALVFQTAEGTLVDPQYAARPSAARQVIGWREVATATLGSLSRVVHGRLLVERYARHGTRLLTRGTVVRV